MFGRSDSLGRRFPFETIGSCAVRILRAYDVYLSSNADRTIPCCFVERTRETRKRR
jgi:hypothetical protein